MPSAEKMGQEIRYDYTNMLEDAVGEHGVDVDVLDEARSRLTQVFATLAAQRAEGTLGFMDLPFDDVTVEEVLKTAADLEGRFENMVILGIGGSALGATAIARSLSHPLHNMLDSDTRGGRPRIFILDNIDPDMVFAVADYINIDKTLFNVVTKSGGTVETMAQLAIFQERLTAALGADASDNVVATTTTGKGDLWAMAQDFGWRTLSIPENVGGRFSVLSSVGLFPAAMLGFDVQGLLGGAALMDRTCRSKDFEQSPSLAYAMLQYCLFRSGAPISILMPYANALYDVADWYRQLWAESLGKKYNFAGEVVHTGPTPVKALGTTDQHSQVQLYVEGPYDKSITFIEVAEFKTTAAIPVALAEYPSTASVAGRSLNELIAAEKKGTEVALTEAGCPNGTLIMPAINELTLGQLFYFFEMATAFSGALYGVNAFDQPGVEAGKIAAYALLGVEKYAERKREIEKISAKNRKII